MKLVREIIRAPSSRSIGSSGTSGQPIGRILARDEQAARSASDGLLATLRWSDQPVDPPPLVHEVVGA